MISWVRMFCSRPRNWKLNRLRSRSHLLLGCLISYSYNNIYPMFFFSFSVWPAQHTIAFIWNWIVHLQRQLCVPLPPDQTFEPGPKFQRNCVEQAGRICVLPYLYTCSSLKFSRITGWLALKRAQQRRKHRKKLKGTTVKEAVVYPKTPVY